MVLASISDVQAYVFVMAVLATIWGLAWDKSDGPNLLIKVGWIVLAVWGWLGIAHRADLKWFIPVTATLCIIWALAWSKKNFFNLFVKLSWGLLAVWGWFCFAA